jgi:hypothetical protein
MFKSLFVAVLTIIALPCFAEETLSLLNLHHKYSGKRNNNAVVLEVQRVDGDRAFGTYELFSKNRTEGMACRGAHPAEIKIDNGQALVTVTRPAPCETNMRLKFEIVDGGKRLVNSRAELTAQD